MELPPRARRIPLAGLLIFLVCGTTSACAENTEMRYDTGLGQGNYLRVRGEYSDEQLGAELGLELPPRARRIP